MNKREIIERLKNIAGHAVHTVGEEPFVMSLDDGIAVREAIELLEKLEPLTDNEQAIDYLHKTGWLQNHDRILTESMEAKKMCEKFDCDFSGWATRYDVKCSDGRTIKRDVFAGDDGKIVPLVFEFNHLDVTNVLGQALLCNRPEGVYMYGKFNETRKGQVAKAMVQRGDIASLGIYAINIKHADGMNVIRGSIKEVSLVAFPANPGAVIDYVVPSSNGHGCSTCKYLGKEICQYCRNGNMWTEKEVSK